jgi:hypothetical protein
MSKVSATKSFKFVSCDSLERLLLRTLVANSLFYESWLNRSLRSLWNLNDLF